MCRVCLSHEELDAAGHEVADDVGLDAAVDRDDPHPLARRVEPRLGVRHEDDILAVRYLQKVRTQLKAE